MPYTRGAEISRPWADIVTEAHALVDAGAREIVLLGQNVNAWADGNRGLADLIRTLATIDGLERIRYTTSHPVNMSDELIAAHGEVAKLMPYLHLPVQSGSNRILKAMNRSHTVETYLATIEKMRDARSDIALSGDFIVGFPGETDEDFEATLKIVDTVRYASAYSFKYSARPGTPAATMEEQIPREIMDERLQRLQERINDHRLAFNRSTVGVDTQVLIEREGRHEGQMIGRSPWLQSVHVDTNARAGDIVDVTLVAAGPNSMTGTVRRAVAACISCIWDLCGPHSCGSSSTHRRIRRTARQAWRAADLWRAGVRGCRLCHPCIDSAHRRGRPLQGCRPGRIAIMDCCVCRARLGHTADFGSKE